MMRRLRIVQKAKKLENKGNYLTQSFGEKSEEL
jgi:hypothetical protein